MKTNHEETRSHASRLTPILRYMNMRSLAVAMFVTEAFLGTTLGNETVRPARIEARAQNNGYVRVPVAIKSGRRTVLALDR
jgi:hypothetical protein